MQPISCSSIRGRDKPSGIAAVATTSFTFWKSSVIWFSQVVLLIAAIARMYHDVHVCLYSVHHEIVQGDKINLLVKLTDPEPKSDL